jgi:hypothetical protein
MSIEWDAHANLPRLKPKPPPPIEMAEILAVDSVTLFAGDQPVPAVRAWYEGKLGLKFIEADVEQIRFMHEQRTIIIQRTVRPELLLEAPDPAIQPHVGKLFLAIRSFNHALETLREHGLHCEMLHTEGGLARMAVTADPAGNWVYFVESRPM